MNTSKSVSGRVVRVSLGGESREVPEEEAFEVGNALHAKFGGVPRMDFVGADAGVSPGAIPLPAELVAVTSVTPAAPKGFSSFSGELIVDEEAKARIEGLQAKLTASGIKVNASEQFYATGTRMAEEGYAVQEGRRREYEKAIPLEEAAHALRNKVRAEGREDVTISAREFGNSIEANGKVKVMGFQITEQAVRGLTGRLGSPALSYVLGLRERVATEAALPLEDQNVAAMRADVARIAETLRHEALRMGDTPLTLRTRKNVGDIFAIVSPSYTPADAPEVIDQILKDLPRDARGTWNYDPRSTAWELRANIFTPTPVQEQAVGEPFEAYASFQARDNGTARFRSGGGAMMLRCLNASVYSAKGTEVSRVHRSNVMYDIAAMLTGALQGINVLCDAWGTRRADVVEIPVVDGRAPTLEEAMPGFWRSLLTDRRSELVAVLPGRTENHVKALTRHFEEERRDADRLVRADFAQSWTRYAQEFDAPTRRDAETAIGDWLVNSKGKMGCILKESRA